MAITYEPIATITSDGTSAYADFTSIPSTYKDLIVVAQFRSGNAGSYTDSYIRLATGGGAVDTGTNYSSTRAYAASTGYATTRYSGSNLLYFVLCTAASSTASVLTNGISLNQSTKPCHAIWIRCEAQTNAFLILSPIHISRFNGPNTRN